MIVSTTLAGPGAEAVIAEALRSVEKHVHHCVVILSGCDEEPTIEAASAAVGAKLIIRREKWPGDYGSARNMALSVAESYGADWAITLDIDERLDLRLEGVDLGDRGVNAYGVMANPPTYSKPRLIRCGVGAKWVGKYCEQLEVEGGICLLPDGGSFSEMPKTPEQERARIDRGIAWCQEMAQAGTITAHWRNHLGECQAALGNWGAAADQWIQVKADESAPPHERTWARLRLTERLLLKGNLTGARTLAGEALAEDPGLIQEFAHILAVASSQLGDNQSALLWAEIGRVAPVDQARGGHRMIENAVPSCVHIVEELGAKGAPFGVKGFRRPKCVSGEDTGHFPFAGRRAAFGEDYALLARALSESLDFTHHCDLGAGNGLLVEAILATGCSSVGVELDQAARETTAPHVRDAITFGRGVDAWANNWASLVSCVEVLEHIPAAESEAAVAAICNASSRWVYFSAAAPGQPGHRHVNCQPKAHWEARFEQHGFVLDQPMTAKVVERISGMKTCWWLPQNAMIFRRVAD